MKKTILLLLVFLLGTTFAFAADTRDPLKKELDSESQTAFIGFGVGPDLTNSDWNSNGVTYGFGGIGQVFGGYQFDKTFAIQVDVDNFLSEGSYPGALISQYNLRGLIEAKYTFDAPGLQPYLLAGGGLVYSLLSQAYAYSTSVNADALVGLGFQFNLNADSHFFIEGRYNFILSSASSLQDIPLTMGIWTGL